MAKKDVNDMTVEELREQAAKRDIEGRSSMSKTELQHALEVDPNESSSPNRPPNPPLGKGKEGIPAPPKDAKGETRLFQRGPDEKVWLTEEQATAEGFYWNKKATHA